MKDIEFSNFGRNAQKFHNANFGLNSNTFSVLIPSIRPKVL